MYVFPSYKFKAVLIYNDANRAAERMAFLNHMELLSVLVFVSSWLRRHQPPQLCPHHSTLLEKIAKVSQKKYLTRPFPVIASACDHAFYNFRSNFGEIMEIVICDRLL